LKEVLYQIAEVKPIYVYKNDDGLKKYKGVVNWHKDPNGIVEKLFFKRHYPCGSFVVISKKGDFISHFGEYAKESIWEVTQRLIN